MSDDKPFSLTEPYYDLSTYMGRVKHFVDVINPTRLFVTDSELDRCKALIADYESGKMMSGTTNTELWRAKKMLAATLHPDTGEKVPIIFRASAFIPSNIPIACGMLLSAPTVFNSILWQWVNQSYNAGFNYSNRPISANKEADSAELRNTLLAYLSATGVSCSLAVGLNLWVEKATKANRFSPTVLRCISVAVPFAAVAGAGSFNVLGMRFKELSDGIPVLHPDTSEELGRSQAVARTALMQCVLSRVVLPAPVLLLPPYLMPLVHRAFAGVAANRYGKVALDLTVLTSTLCFALPFAIALFPQTGSFPVADLEPEIRARAEKARLTTVLFNKGL